MPLRELLSVAKSLMTAAIARRGAILSSLALIERLLVPAAAWSFFRYGVTAQMVLVFAAGVVFSSRTFLQQAFRARTEIDLLQLMASRLIGGDVLRADLLRDEDERAELGQAMYHAAENVSVGLPLLLADGLAAPALAMIVLAKEPSKLIGLTIAMTVAAGGGLFVARRPIERVLAVAWTAQQEAFTGFMNVLEGRLEVVASGHRVEFLAQMQARAAAWGKAGARVAAGTLVSGKLPFLLVATIAAGAIGLSSSRAHGAWWVTTADIALLASMTPAFTGIAQDLFALARTRRWMGVVARALSERPLAIGGPEAPPPLPATIAFDRVSFFYEGVETPALREVSFAWKKERVLALTGPNGSGKSTCLRLLLALAKPRSGSVTVGGLHLDRFDADAWRRGLAFLPQRPYLPPRSDVGEAIRFMAPEATDDEIRRALDRVGLSTRLERFGGNPLAIRIGVLSVGERQRVGIARLLCNRASLILLDEPDANLDRSGVALMASLIRDLAQHAMVVLAAHSAELLETADRILILDGGCLVADETRRQPALSPVSATKGATR
jgi:ABC-type multidrug transport system fused ATPase/permease subunit